jgi:hypothetical protein
MSRGREEKIILFEIANESWQNGFSGQSGVDELRALTRHMNDRTEILVASSAPPETSEQEVQAIYRGGIADIATVHFDRDVRKTEGSWRPVRQPWEHEYNRSNGVPVGANNEPIGPGSSVASENDPIRLVAAAIVTHVANIPMYVFHSRAGVFGRVELQDMAGVTSFRFVKSIVPGDLASWSRKNAHWGDSPFKCFAIDSAGNFFPDSMWPDHGQGAQGGAVRAYGGVKGNEFFVCAIGIKNRLPMEPRRDCDFDIIDPMTGQVVRSLSLSAGQRFELTGGEVFVLKGRYR